MPSLEGWARLACGTGAAARLARDSVGGMTEVAIRDLRNHGGEVLDRVEGGEVMCCPQESAR